MKTSTIRPGLLVSLKTTVSGNVRYAKQTLIGEHIVDGGAQKAKWETERTIEDPAEFEAAKKARGSARQAITRVCANSAFGLLCPENAAGDLEKAVAEARKIADEFNETAFLTRLTVYVITGRIAPDDVEAVKAINSEIADMLRQMEDGIRRLDVKAVREAASAARQMGAMLSPDAAAKVRIAIDTARDAAKRIVKAGEQAAGEIDQRTLATLAEARTAFLDFDDNGNEIGAPAESARAIDLAPPVRNNPADGYMPAPRDLEI